MVSGTWIAPFNSYRSLKVLFTLQATFTHVLNIFYPHTHPPTMHHEQFGVQTGESAMIPGPQPSYMRIFILTYII